MSMQNTFFYLLSMLVESIALSCCILAVFRDQKDLRKRDFILVPSVSLCLLIARSSYGGASPGFHLTQGFFLAPADNFPILLILLMGLLLLTSIRRMADAHSAVQWRPFLFICYATSAQLSLRSFLTWQAPVSLLWAALLPCCYVSSWCACPGFRGFAAHCEQAPFWCRYSQ